MAKLFNVKCDSIYWPTVTGLLSRPRVRLRQAPLEKEATRNGPTAVRNQWRGFFQSSTWRNSSQSRASPATSPSPGGARGGARRHWWIPFTSPLPCANGPLRCLPGHLHVVLLAAEVLQTGALGEGRIFFPADPGPTRS
eukprot:scaffold1741_cov262-Pinguiococcus_pyrenoidosus.AAC.33